MCSIRMCETIDLTDFPLSNKRMKILYVMLRNPVIVVTSIVYRSYLCGVVMRSLVTIHSTD